MDLPIFIIWMSLLSKRGIRSDLKNTQHFSMKFLYIPIWDAAFYSITSEVIWCLPLFLELSHLMRKSTICIGENKDAYQLRGDREADQRLCFRYSESTNPLLLKSEISSLCLLWLYSPVYIGPVMFKNHIVGIS